MTKPVYKIELWDTVPAKLHTITKGAELIYIKEVLTDAVGSFSFALPTEIGSSYKYNDVSVGHTAKIWLADDTVPADPLTVGKIYHISAPLVIDSGYVRVFTGKNQGEILQRRFKTKRWEATEASTIVTELATDLSLGTSKIEATSGKSVTMQVDETKYVDIMKQISDYWITGGAEITRDFYVDWENDLVWADRDGTSPFRSGASVETFTVGATGNVDSYTVSRDMTELYNKITVYGRAEKSSENDKDAWCESHTSPLTWSAPDGGTVTTNGDSMLGSNSIQINEDPSSILVLRCSGTDKSALYWRDFKQICFNVKVPSTSPVGTIGIRIYATNMANYFRTFLTPDHHGVSVGGDWKGINLPIGKDYEVAEGLLGYNGDWEKVNSPDWTDMHTVEFRIAFTASADQTARIDAFHFYGARYSDTAEDATSQTNYGVKELVVVDENLMSDSECEAMSEALIDLYKDPALQIELTTRGNTNVLLGDRLSMTIPAEGISAQNFDVYQIEHALTGGKQGGFTTKTVLQSATKHRRKIPTNVRDLTVEARKMAKEAWMVKRVFK